MKLKHATFEVLNAMKIQVTTKRSLFKSFPHKKSLCVSGIHTSYMASPLQLP